MGDHCPSTVIEVEVQSNGIIRDSVGRIIATLVEGVSYDTLGKLPECACGGSLVTAAERYIGKCENCVPK